MFNGARGVWRFYSVVVARKKRDANDVRSRFVTQVTDSQAFRVYKNTRYSQENSTKREKKKKGKKRQEHFGLCARPLALRPIGQPLLLAY